MCCISPASETFANSPDYQFELDKIKLMFLSKSANCASIISTLSNSKIYRSKLQLPELATVIKYTVSEAFW